MDDPLSASRTQLAAQLAGLGLPQAQRELFAAPLRSTAGSGPASADDVANADRDPVVALDRDED